MARRQGRALLRPHVFLVLALIVAVVLIARHAWRSSIESLEQEPMTSEPSTFPMPSDTTPVADEGFVGVIVARESVQVATKFEGRLIEVGFRVGDRVQGDEVVARLDEGPIRRQLDVATTALEQVRTEFQRALRTLELTQYRYERKKRLYDYHKTASEEELKLAEYERDVALAEVDVAAMQIKQQEALVEEVKQRLKDATLLAPFDGTVGARYLDPGALVRPGTPILRLIASDDLWVRFAVPEATPDQVQVQQQVTAHVDVLDLDVPATVRHIASEVDAASGMVLAEAELDTDSWPAPEKERIKSGMVAHVHLRPTPSAGGADEEALSR